MEPPPATLYEDSSEDGVKPSSSAREGGITISGSVDSKPLLINAEVSTLFCVVFNFNLTLTPKFIHLD